MTHDEWCEVSIVPFGRGALLLSEHLRRADDEYGAPPELLEPRRIVFRNDGKETVVRDLEGIAEVARSQGVDLAEAASTAPTELATCIWNYAHEGTVLGPNIEDNIRYRDVLTMWQVDVATATPKVHGRRLLFHVADIRLYEKVRKLLAVSWDLESLQFTIAEVPLQARGQQRERDTANTSQPQGSASRNQPAADG